MPTLTRSVRRPLPLCVPIAAGTQCKCACFRIAELDSDDEDGPAQVEEEEEDDDEEEEENETGGAGGYLEGDMGDEGNEGRIVLQEDKKYYPTAMEVYGEEVETTVQEEDTQPITQPIVAPIKPKNYDLVEKRPPRTVYSQEFMLSMMNLPELVRNIVVIGHMQHGKTSFVDNLVRRAVASPPTRAASGTCASVRDGAIATRGRLSLARARSEGAGRTAHPAAPCRARR